MNSYSTSWSSLLLINRPREDERLSWPCWLTYTADVWPTKWSSVQLAVRRMTGKVRRSKTSVLPLCYAANINWNSPRDPLIASRTSEPLRVTFTSHTLIYCTWEFSVLFASHVYSGAVRRQVIGISDDFNVHKSRVTRDDFITSSWRLWLWRGRSLRWLYK